MTGKIESSIENEVKNLIKKSLEKRLIGFDNIDPTLAKFTLIEQWITDIMALGYNDFDVEASAKDIYELQKPIHERFLEDYRARVFLSNNRFSEEICAFKKYLELKDKESDKVILYAVKEELESVESGIFFLSWK